MSYIEAHGTGTAIGDPIEIEALSRVFPAAPHRRIGIGSVKTNVGHLDAAAGIAGLIKTVLALAHKRLPPSLHYVRPNPRIPFDATPFFVVDRAQDWPAGSPRRAGVSSFGIGGTNAHVVLEEAPPAAVETQSEEPHVFVLSARSAIRSTSSSRRIAAAQRASASR